MTDVRWELLMPDGRVVQGQGQDAPGGMKLSTLAKDASFARFTFGPLQVYVMGGIDLHWSMQRVIGYGPEAKAMGLPPVSRALALMAQRQPALLWIMPDGSIGLARTVEEVGLAFRAFAIAKARR